MLAIAPGTALTFLPVVLPIALWVAWSDMSAMRIPNRAVWTLLAGFAILGLIALPFPDYLRRWLQAAGVLAVCFVLYLARAMGAGDAKFLAAMAPFVDPRDSVVMLQILAAALVTAFALHRAARAIPALRRALPDWKSWTHPKFPAGLALSGALVLYLALGALAP